MSFGCMRVLTLSGHYDLRLVAVSIFIAVVASYAALDIAARMQTAGKGRRRWLGCGAIALGGGIWAMHYLGMAAYQLPIPVLYDLPTVVLSLLAAVLGSGVSLSIVSKPELSGRNTFIGSLFLGGGIASMHYIGMAAMRLAAMHSYSRFLFTLSVVLAVVISYAALRTVFRFRSDDQPSLWPKLGAAVLLGLAIPTMHYLGMAAVSFVPVQHIHGAINRAVGVSSLSLYCVSLITMTVLAALILQAASGRKIAVRDRELASREVQTQTIFDNLKEGVVVLDRERNIVQINQSAKAMLGLAGPRSKHEDLAGAFSVTLAGGEPLHPDAWPSALALRGEFLQNCELHIARTDTGKSIVSEISTAPIYDRDGKMAQIIVTYRDVTQPERLTRHGYGWRRSLNLRKTQSSAKTATASLQVGISARKNCSDTARRTWSVIPSVCCCRSIACRRKMTSSLVSGAGRLSTISRRSGARRTASLFTSHLRFLQFETRWAVLLALLKSLEISRKRKRWKAAFTKARRWKLLVN